MVQSEDIVSGDRGEILHAGNWPQEYSKDTQSSNRGGVGTVTGDESRWDFPHLEDNDQMAKGDYSDNNCQ